MFRGPALREEESLRLMMWQKYVGRFQAILIGIGAWCQIVWKFRVTSVV